MADLQRIVPVITLIVFSSIHEYLYASIQRTFTQNGMKYPRLFITCSIVKLLWNTAGALMLIPLPIFLIAQLPVFIFSAAAVTGEFKIVRLEFLAAFLSYSSLMLIVFGCVSLSGSIMAINLFRYASVRAWMIAAVNFVQCIIQLLLRKIPLKQIDIQEDPKQERFFSLFLACCIAYIFMDSVFCMIDSENLLVALLLISGNLLLILLLFLFLVQKWSLSHKRTVELEYEQLTAQRAQEQIKRKQLQESIERDSLTGCLTRVIMMEQIQKLMEEGKEFTIAFIDMDGLKKVNDQHGHRAGDQLLVNFAQNLRRKLREEDLLARIGGDEFLLLLSGCALEAARERLGKIRAWMLTSECEGGPISFSFGLASGEEGVRGLIRVADQNMYLDKKRKERGPSDYDV